MQPPPPAIDLPPREDGEPLSLNILGEPVPIVPLETEPVVPLVSVPRQAKSNATTGGSSTSKSSRRGGGGGRVNKFDQAWLDYQASLDYLEGERISNERSNL